MKNIKERKAKKLVRFDKPEVYEPEGEIVTVHSKQFDPETGEWKGGFEEQRTEWEREYAEAHARWEAHRKQMTEAKEADQAAAVESGDASAYSSESATSEGTLADDSSLQALRDKLTTE